MDERLTAEQVRAWLHAVEADMRRLGEKLEPLLAEQRQLEERQTLLEGLLRSFEQTTPNGSGPSEPVRTTGSVARHVVERAVEILRDEGSPLHINDLHARFVERGYPIPGAGKSANLIVHLRNAEEIASPQRGMYGLAGQVGAMRQKPRSSKRRKRTVRTQGGTS